MNKRLLLALPVLTILMCAIFFNVHKNTRASDARIVTVHTDGEAKTIATNAKTVAGVMKRLGTELDEHDKTEPAMSEKIHGADFTINVYRARPITVVDGPNNYTVVTAERSPAAIAKDAGFKVAPEDELIYRRSDNSFAGSPGTQMIIVRSKTLYLACTVRKLN